MNNTDLVKLVARSLRKSASPSKNGAHKPDRYQASVTAEDLGHALESAGLVQKWHHFYAEAMPSRDSAETWNDL
jgi:hypothetical protein